LLPPLRDIFWQTFLFAFYFVKRWVAMKMKQLKHAGTKESGKREKEKKAATGIEPPTQLENDLRKQKENPVARKMPPPRPSAVRRVVTFVGGRLLD
jgi:hypothetical protein